jgi:hypothetical protein
MLSPIVYYCIIDLKGAEMDIFIPLKNHDKKNIVVRDVEIPKFYVDISKKIATCPDTGDECRRHRFGKRTVRHLDRIVEYKTSTHYSANIHRYFTLVPEGASLGYKYGNDVYDLVDRMFQYSLTDIRWYLNENHNLLLRESTIHDIKMKNLRVKEAAEEAESGIAKEDRVTVYYRT